MAQPNRAREGLGSSAGLGELKIPGQAGFVGDEPKDEEQTFLLPSVVLSTLAVTMAIGAVLAASCCPLLFDGLGDLALLDSGCTELRIGER